jgi:hypothetical protein
MFGFVSNLFSSKKNDDSVVQPKVKPEKVKPEAKAVVKPARVDNSNAYFLEADKASTMGDVDYMRAARTTRRTFPKTASGSGTAFEQTVSSMDVKKGVKGSASESKSTTTQSFGMGNSGSSESTQAETKRRRPDRSMDVFRNMAKEIRK